MAMAPTATATGFLHRHLLQLTAACVIAFFCFSSHHFFAIATGVDGDDAYAAAYEGSDAVRIPVPPAFQFANPRLRVLIESIRRIRSMGKKRKSVGTRLDEVDRSLYSTFRSAANSLSQIYTQAMAQQKLAFQAGERHALEKLHQSITRHNEAGSRVTVAEIMAYLQHEMDQSDDGSISSSVQSAHEHYPPSLQYTNPNIQNSSGMCGSTHLRHGPRTGQSDQTKNRIFTNALSSSVRSSLQPYQLAQSEIYNSATVLPQENENRDHEMNHTNQNRDANASCSTDSTMDMHSDSPIRGPF